MNKPCAPLHKKVPACYAKKDKLSFGLGNAKLSLAVATFSLPAGHSCPFAKECFSKADKVTGKIVDGEHCHFRCFAASQECVYTSVRLSRWRNFDFLREAKTVQNMADLIQRSLPFGTNYVRLHVSGDFFSETYFLAWLNVAIANPKVVFYAYTKSIPFWLEYRKEMPKNFRLTASKGGKCDNLIGKHRLKYAEVVFSTEEARRKGLEIDHDDLHAIEGDKPFALLLHGTQPAGTLAGDAWKLIKLNEGGYSRHRVTPRPEKAVNLSVIRANAHSKLMEAVKVKNILTPAGKPVK